MNSTSFSAFQFSHFQHCLAQTMSPAQRVWVCLCTCVALVAAAEVSLEEAVVLLDEDAGPVLQKAAQVLQEEVHARSMLTWTIQHTPPQHGTPVVHLIQEGTSGEGYSLKVEHNQDKVRVVVAGQSARGVLFGVGRLLRELRLQVVQDYNTPMVRTAKLNADLHIESEPAYHLRYSLLFFFDVGIAEDI